MFCICEHDYVKAATKKKLNTILRNVYQGTREMDLVTKVLYNHEDLSSDSEHPHKKLHTMA